MKKMIIMRGVPGSGKSFTAKNIIQNFEGGGAAYCSTDNFFMVNGEYKFNPNKIKMAHEWNRDCARAAIGKSVPLVIVDNTNTQKWEYSNYVDMARAAGYSVEFQFPTSPWWKKIEGKIKDKTFNDKDVEEFHSRNKHSVPFEVIKKMMIRFEF